MALNEFEFDYSKTQGENYRFEDGEREAVEEFGKRLREAFKLLDEALEYGKSAGFYVYSGIDKDENGEYKVPSNFNCDIDCVVRINDEWMASTNYC